MGRDQTSSDLPQHKKSSQNEPILYFIANELQLRLGLIHGRAGAPVGRR
jgi:hypothetical protein